MAERRRRPALALAGAAVALAVTLAGPGPAAPLAPAPVAAQVPGDGPQLPADPPATPRETRDRADEILRRREYQGPEATGESLLERLRRWVADRLPEVDVPGGDSSGSRAVSFVVVAAVALGAFGALTWLLVGTRRTRRAPEDAVDAEVEVTPLRTAAEWAAEADRLAAAGEHRAAVRARFRALVADLARRDLVADTPGRTAGELRDDVADRAPALAPAFAAAADQFEQVWFGGGPVGPADPATARDLAARVLAAAPRRAPAGAGADAGAER